MSYLKNHPINPDWLIKGVTKETVKYAEELAKHLVEEKTGARGYEIYPLTTSQLRKFFGAVKNLQMNIIVNGFSEGEFVMLKPKLAYAVGRVRQKNKLCPDIRIEVFADVISNAIDIVNNTSDKKTAFKNFISFFEAIVAYHKHYGKDNIK